MPLGLPHSRFLAWSEDDQAKALAYVRREREKCSRCGTRKAEWEKDRFAFVGNIEVCPGCEVLEQESGNIPEAERRSMAYKVGLVRREDAVAP